MYAGGRDEAAKDQMAVMAMPAAPSANAAADGAMNKSLNFRRSQLQAAQGALGGESFDREVQQLNQPINPVASITSAASAAKARRAVPVHDPRSVSLPRQRSAMIPIITDPVEVERVSIYRQSVLPRNPLNGAKVTNTTGKHLLAGPVTVLANGSYAGDAQIDNLPPGQNRLLSYGIDLQMLVDVTPKEEEWLQTGSIVKGVLKLQRKHLATSEYAIQNKGDEDKTLIVEHPFRPDWKLVEPAKSTRKPTRSTVQRPDKTGQSNKLTVKRKPSSAKKSRSSQPTSANSSSTARPAKSGQRKRRPGQGHRAQTTTRRHPAADRRNHQ